MKFLSVLLCCVALCFPACSWTPEQKQKAANVGAVIGSTLLNLAQTATDAALKYVVARAGSDADLTAKGNLIDSAAQGLRTLQGQTSGLVTPALVQSTISQFTDPTKQHWGDLATSLAKTYATSSTSQDVALEGIAEGLNTAAAQARADAVNP